MRKQIKIEGAKAQAELGNKSTRTPMAHLGVNRAAMVIWTMYLDQGVAKKGFKTGQGGTRSDTIL